MGNKLRNRSVIFAALVAAWAISGAALAGDPVPEVEPNDPATSAQALVIGSDGTATVKGSILVDGLGIRDIDFYSFEGKAGDVITVDIDGGMITQSQGLNSVLAIFGPNGTFPLSQKAQSSSLDPGSVSLLDARIDNFHLDVTGKYIIGVSSMPGQFIDINTLSNGGRRANSSGSYTLIISGVTPPPSIQLISIKIRPDTTEVPRINPKSGGHVPVALLSSPDFNPADVDRTTLTFGATGNEKSFERCNKDDEDALDYNGDGRPDLVCRFDNRAANFEVENTEGVIRGKTRSGKQFEGHGWLKVIHNEHGKDEEEHGKNDEDHGHEGEHGHGGGKR
jgi:hypothetical protein